MKRLICVVAIVLIGTISLFAQYSAEQRDSIKHAQYRQEIGLDMSVPDFEATEIQTLWGLDLQIFCIIC